MKLLHCLDCGDIVKLEHGDVRACACGQTSGERLDAKRVAVDGNGLLIGIGDDDFKAALGRLHDQVEAGSSVSSGFSAWIISPLSRSIV